VRDGELSEVAQEGREVLGLVECGDDYSEQWSV
jgi:hypothetical protein